MKRISAILFALAVALPVTTTLALQYTHPDTGRLLPPEPEHNGCFCSVHHKSDPAPKEPAKPFRQGFDAPLIETVPDVLEPVK